MVVTTIRTERGDVPMKRIVALAAAAAMASMTLGPINSAVAATEVEEQLGEKRIQGRAASMGDRFISNSERDYWSLHGDRVKR